MVVEFLVQLALKEPSGHVMSRTTFEPHPSSDLIHGFLFEAFVYPRMADGESVAVRHLG